MITIPDRVRFVRHFFKDEIVTIKPKKYEKEIMNATGMDKVTFDKWVQAGAEINHGFSKGVHPTFRSVAYNSDKKTGEFDYDAKNFKYYPIDGFDFAHFVIIPTIDAVTIPSEVFGISSNDLSEIFELREKIQKIAIKKNQNKK